MYRYQNWTLRFLQKLNVGHVLLYVSLLAAFDLF